MLGKYKYLVNSATARPAGTFSFAWPRSSAHRLHFIRLTETLRQPSHLDDLGFSSSPSPYYCFASLFASIFLSSSLLLSFSLPLTTFPSSFILFRQNYPSFQLLLSFALSPLFYFHLFNIFSDSPTWLPSFIFFYIGAVACCAPVSILRHSLDFFSAPATVFSGLAPTSPTAPLHDFFDPCSCAEPRPTASRCCSGLDISISNFLSVVRYTVSFSSLFRQDVPSPFRSSRIPRVMPIYSTTQSKFRVNSP